ncbi:hypothetical protein [Chitinophaga sp. Ak27]|uniref:hypothetical protein n=1 Tax=Chitinophaga sp. Ak27 TaxID=2726116 RepID=UPI00145D72AC|nr:hypothetical protein [Chitinophaga sp. Ak27]NLU95715.1 hypothetical protein [Chitinophaga sp. Ak27]
MNNSFEIKYILKCLELVEARLNWGPSSEWTTYDFEKLSSIIAETTGVTLSITTLKRLWGKIRYNNIPAVTTLNTLAKFAGYDSWREFKQQVSLHPVGNAQPDRRETTVLPPVRKVFPRRWMLGLMGFLPLLLIGYLLLSSNKKPGKPLDPVAFAFSSNKIMSTGVPNSVIFHYNALAAGVADSVFISQSWDTSRKVAVPRQENTWSSIYYAPGYYRAKLMVNKQIVKEHDLMIASDGWLALLEAGPGAPYYFRKTDIEKDSGIAVNKALLAASGIQTLPTPPALRFFNVRDMGDLDNYNFTFETTLKSDFKEGTAACQRIQVLILCKNDVIFIPLCAKGCVGDLSLYAAGTTVNSQAADLSGLGCTPEEWTTLKVTAVNGKMQVWVNGKAAANLTMVHAPTGIVGLQYRFNGTGAIKDTRFTQHGKTIVF